MLKQTMLGKFLTIIRKKIKPVGSLKTLIQSNDLIDIWRYKNKTDIQFTWRRKNPDQASRIDMFLINKDFLMNIKSCDIRPILIKFTDHQAVSLKIETVTMKSKGPGYWKINNSILQEEKYVKNINKIIQKYSFKINEDKNRMDLWWDYMKIEIKHYSIKYCKAKAIDRKNELNKLEKELRALSSLQDTVKDNKEIIEKINVIENKIEKIYEYKAKGTQIRARQDWIEKGEKNNAYFLGLEKSNQTKKTILKLKNDKGQIITDKAEIIKVEKLYYEKLYSKNIKLNQNTRDYLEKTNSPRKLTKDESTSCNGYITLEELENAVKNLKPNKSPRLDGLSSNFYKTFLQNLGPLLMIIFNSSYDRGKLPFSQRQSVLNLLFKKGDPLELSNFRPISLLNTDYKILS